MIGSIGSSGALHRLDIFAAGRRAPAAKPGAKPGAGPGDLSDEERKEVEDLRETDREVHRHEEAHKAAAGSYAVSGPHYDYKRGPDGARYAVGGEVKLDLTPEKEPEDTIRKARTIRKAALAPKDPSPQDRKVAAEAMKMESKARADLRKESSRVGGPGAEPLDEYRRSDPERTYDYGSMVDTTV